MSDEVEPVADPGVAPILGFAEKLPLEQQRTKIGKHPDVELIHALLRRGKSAKWVSQWLEARYPTEDDIGMPTENATENVRWHVTAHTIDKYRREWLPECAAGVDVVSDKLTKVLGHQLPADVYGRATPMELDILEAVIGVGQHNLARAVQNDDELGMLQPTTLDAARALLEAAKTRGELAQKLNQPGYEPRAKEIHLQAETKNLNVEVNADGGSRARANEPRKIKLVEQLMDMPRDEARRVLDQAQRAADAMEDAVDATVVEPEVSDE